MKFGILTDSHYGKNPMVWGQNRLLSDRAHEVVERLVGTFNREANLDFVIHLGDIIQDDAQNPSAVVDRQNLFQVRELLGRLRMPSYFALGNHDLMNLSAESCAEALGMGKPYYRFESAGTTCLVLCSDCPVGASIVVPPQQLEWLQSELHTGVGDIVVFLHHCPSELNLDGSYWWDKNPKGYLIENRARLRSILESTGRVRGVFHGHIHTNERTVHSGIPYVAVESCIENYRMDGQASESAAIVTVSQSLLEVELLGHNAGGYRSFTRTR